jgi:hypothetical protein
MAEIGMAFATKVCKNAILRTLGQVFSRPESFRDGINCFIVFIFIGFSSYCILWRPNIRISHRVGFM